MSQETLKDVEANWEVLTVLATTEISISMNENILKALPAVLIKENARNK